MIKISKIQLTIFFVTITSTLLFSQDRCGTMNRLNYEITIDDQLNDKRQRIEKKIKRWKNLNFQNSYNIPVVFHIIYENNDENVSLDQIMSQLSVLNEDFNRNNSDANQTSGDFIDVAADCNINFCLAQRTPNNDSSSGITYTQTNITSFSLYDNRIFHDSLGGKDIWDPNKYLNIYVCDLSNALGFASFPGTSQSRDAVVINYNNFGTINILAPYNKGRTTTHEVGHWLNLLHIWGDGNCGNDQVDDTPIQNSANYGCPSHPSPSCSNEGDMFQNFMDYTDDGCMNLFTNGQKNRMHATLNSQRSSVTQSQACDLPFEDVGIIDNISPYNFQELCGNEFNLITSLYNYSNFPIYKTQIHFQLNNQETQMLEWFGNLLPNSSIDVNLGNFDLENGQHSLLVYTSNPNDFRDLNFLNDSLEIIFFMRDGVSYEINIQTDNYAEENSWEILNNNNEIIAYENNLVSNQINTFNFCQDTDSCYTLFVFDEYEDGICCDFGNGYISVNNITYDGDFNSEIEIDLCATSAVDKLENINDILFYPNPTNGNLIIKSLRNIEFLKIYDLRGKIVFQKYCDSKQENLNLHKLYKGSYIIQINTQEGTTSHKKIIIQ
tara:strand:- start:360 stop:2183 length:1824 start_codon:yes stop_codon:yes gene_type:complete